LSTSEGDIYVNYGNVSNVEDALSDADIQINAVLENLQAMVSQLQATWAGVSQDEYTQVQARWTADTADMQNVLKNYNSTLGEMTYNYGSTDNNLAFQWSEIR
jgi:WXG100 family type VII secretion target